VAAKQPSGCALCPACRAGTGDAVEPCRQGSRPPDRTMTDEKMSTYTLPSASCGRRRPPGRACAASSAENARAVAMTFSPRSCGACSQIRLGFGCFGHTYLFDHCNRVGQPFGNAVARSAPGRPALPAPAQACRRPDDLPRSRPLLTYGRPTDPAARIRERCTSITAGSRRPCRPAPRAGARRRACSDPGRRRSGTSAQVW